jgi:hypothetical protein
MRPHGLTAKTDSNPSTRRRQSVPVLDFEEIFCKHGDINVRLVFHLGTVALQLDMTEDLAKL